LLSVEAFTVTWTHKTILPTDILHTMYFDDIFDTTELTKARKHTIKMHPDKLPKISQVETDAAPLSTLRWKKRQCKGS
jgi:hypothetical protein